MRKGWTPEDDAMLIALVSNPEHRLSTNDIAELMGRSQPSVKHRASRLGYHTVGRKRPRRHSDSLLEAMVALTEEGLTQRQIAGRLGMPKHCVSSLIRKRGKARRIAYWTPEEDNWIRANYPNRDISLKTALPGRTARAISNRANALGAKRPQGKRKGSPGKKRLFDEAEVCRMFHELGGTLPAVAKHYGSCATTMSRILRRNGVDLCAAHRSRLEDSKGAIIADYREGKISMVQMAVKYGASDDAIRGRLRAWGAYDPARKNAFVNRVPVYDVWLAKHGVEEADRRWVAYLAKHQSNVKRGKDNPSYGKPSPQGSGNGWKGWYRGHYFRSLREATFMLEMDAANLDWETAEGISIPYVFNGGPRTYHPDYIIGTRLVEIKPTRLHRSPNVTAKRIAAEAYCAAHGLTYELIDAPINAQAIYEAMRAKLVRFDRDYEARFLAYVAVHSARVPEGVPPS